MNIVILQGRIVDDIEIKDYQSFKVCNFTIAVKRSYKNRNGEYDTDFIQCQTTNQQALFLKQYFHKGDPISIEGSWQVRTYDRDGVRSWFNTCVVKNISFALTQKSNNPTDLGNGSNTYNQTQNYNQTPVYQEPKTNVIPGKMSSWQQPITQNKDVNNQTNKNHIPQAFDIPMDDEFLPSDDGFLF